jgi:ubiquinone biosynthesis protein Coq4
MLSVKIIKIKIITMSKVIIKMRSKVLVYLTHQMVLPILSVLSKPEKFPFNQEQLKQFPEGSAGKDLIEMLNEKKLQLLPNYARHDIKHLLLQYDTTDEGEVCLQCFMLGNGHLSLPVVATVLFGYITMPEYWSKFKMALKRGAESTVVTNWQWVTLLHQPTSLLRYKINSNEKN